MLQEALASPRAELVAVFGRRRVGKTFLIREIYADRLVFELTGSHAGDMATQLKAFAISLERATGSVAPLSPPRDWTDAFRLLETHLSDLRKPKTGKHVVFLDELPWLATRRSGFLTAFEHFWNGWASAQPWLVVVICGSAASWMLRKVVKQRGGLHNRVTRRIRLEPFLLPDTRAYLKANGVHLDLQQVAELYMALGGVPHYLNEARPGQSAAQIIDRACFSREGALRTEFEALYAALFERAERHEQMVRAVASKRRGLDRNELLQATGFPSGGTTTKILEELEESGFIATSVPLGRRKRDQRYYLADEYSAFFLSWLDGQKSSGEGAWLKKRMSPRFRAWSGLAFERLCLKHVAAIKRALGIAAVDTEEAMWAHRARSGDDEGAQIDLVIDRADRCVNLCEMKYSESEYVIDKAYARELARKREIFARVEGMNKTLFLTLVTTHGLRQNEHAARLGVQTVSLDAFFEG